MCREAAGVLASGKVEKRRAEPKAERQLVLYKLVRHRGRPRS
jgi:hypothetical protein